MLNKRFKNSLSILALAAIIGITGCSAGTADTSNVVASSSTQSTTVSNSSTSNTSKTTTQQLEAVTTDEADLETAYVASTATVIRLSDSKININGKGASANGSVLTISKAGTYVISGSLKAGQLIVDADKEEKVHIILNGVTISSNSGPVVWVKSTEKVILTLAEGTVNTLKDSKNYTLSEGEDEPDAAVFSKEDLTINGSGKLILSGNYTNGIKSKDTLLVMGGTLEVTATKHALSGKDAVGVFGGASVLTSGEDAVHSSSQVYIKAGTLKISAEDDGIHADAALIIDGGIINIAKSYEGLESANITVNDGDINLTAKDDGFNAAGGNDGSGLEGQSVEQNFSTQTDYFIKINGGNIQVNADGDGLDANGSIYVTGGTTLVSGPTNNGNGAMDYDGNCEVTGGVLAIAGSSGMAQAPSASSKQNSVIIYYTNVQTEGTLASLVDSTGKAVVSFAPAKEYQTIVISSPSLEKGKTYTLISGGQSSVALSDNYAKGGTITGGSTLTKLTLTDVTTSVSDKGVAVTGGMGGGKGGGRGTGPKTGQDGTPPPNSGTTPPEPPSNTNSTTK